MLHFENDYNAMCHPIILEKMAQFATLRMSGYGDDEICKHCIDMIRKLCEYKGVEIIEAEACKDHIHMLVSLPPKYSVSQFMGYLKGKSSLMIFEKYANLKYKYGNRHFWCRGYYVSTVGKNRKAIEQYIRNQLQEDYADDQMSIKEYVDPFTGEPVKEGKWK